MRVSPEKLKQIAHGCCEVREEANGVFFDRMNEPLREFYSMAEGSQTRARSPAGVRLRFRSDTSCVRASFRYGRQARPIFGADLFVDAQLAGTLGPEAPAECWSGELFQAPSREQREFDLWLPYALETWIESFEIEDGAVMARAAAEPAMWLAVGDSITQGMTATSPSRTYAAIAARRLKVRLHNTGVGGAQMAKTEGAGAALIPCNFATVAFGVNDWNHAKSLEQFRQDTTDLLSELLERRPGLPVGLLTPLPVLERETVNSAGVSIEDYRDALRNVAENFPGVTVIEGPSLVSADPACFVDGVHPNDRGMAEIGERLAEKLKGTLAEASGSES